MSKLLVRARTEQNPQNPTAITPQSAGWGYVGFSVYHLQPGEDVSEQTHDREVILVLIEGKASIKTRNQNFGLCGDRLHVFEKTPPHCVYVPGDDTWHIVANTQCTVGVCSAPAKGGHLAARIGPEGIAHEVRGQDTNQRFINKIAMDDRDVADHLLVTEVYTPAGNWSSYPPHRHDADDEPHTTYLEETYYHRLNPKQGFAFQRVFTEDGELDETMTVHDGDVVLVPKGHHPCGAPHGYELYYLNVMAGPVRRWRFVNHPDHDWIAKQAS
ncbi:MAG: 5-deoxy-glucuronate isomerase [Pseudomonadota bacterium]